MPADRRTFLQLLAAGAATALPGSISRAMAIPANNLTGTIADVEHVVILMQENRSFDHYLGTLNGVRGFSDPRAATLSTGQSVFHQPSGTNGYTLPFHPDAADLGLTFIEDLPHDWASTHRAWNNGAWDGWVGNKGTTSMAHLTRADIPFHYALADAFTVCDAYHCSMFGPTSPNRYYMWTGWVGNDGQGGGPVIDNATNGYSWVTFPERLQAAGITWHVYQDVGEGVGPAAEYGEAKNALVGNYGDNALLFFNQYTNAVPGSPCHQGACTGTNAAAGEGLFDTLAADVRHDRLPQVAWVVAPEAYSEHPNWPANYGAYYISQVLDALTANPAVWSKTVLIVMYDENDGFFDHMISPTPPPDSAHGASTVDTTHEYYLGSKDNPAGVYGLGVRVPCFIVSPWSRGGHVNSQLFDHTSLIRFICAVFGPRVAGGLAEPNITPWRAAVCGDLTSCFDFSTPNSAALSLPATTAYRPPNGDRQKKGYVPAPPAAQGLPVQERGQRPARALPYEMTATSALDPAAGSVTLTFAATGRQAVVFLVRSANPLDGPRSYTVAPGTSLDGSWSTGAKGYDLSVSGPNGFCRRFAGRAPIAAAGVSVTESYQPMTQTISLTLTNHGRAQTVTQVADGYGGGVHHVTLAAWAQVISTHRLDATQGWYDLRVTVPGVQGFGVQLAGHLENGAGSMTDPLLG